VVTVDGSFVSMSVSNSGFLELERTWTPPSAMVRSYSPKRSVFVESFTAIFAELSRNQNNSTP
jgi:hypothetical protein